MGLTLAMALVLAVDLGVIGLSACMIKDTLKHEAWLRTLEWDWVPGSIRNTRWFRLGFAILLGVGVGLFATGVMHVIHP